MTMDPAQVGGMLGGTPAPAAPAPASEPTAPAATPAAPAAPAAENEKGPVPYARFEEVNGAKNALQTELEQLRAAEAERQRAAMTELERAQADAQTRQQEAESASARAVNAERSLDIWKAAHAAEFRVPDDAVTFLTGRLSELDSPEKIKAAVQTLATERPDLVGPVNGGKPTPIGGVAGPSTPTAEVPLGADGKPDVKLGLGQDLLAALGGRQRQ